MQKQGSILLPWKSMATFPLIDKTTGNNRTWYSGLLRARISKIQLYKEMNHYSHSIRYLFTRATNRWKFSMKQKQITSRKNFASLSSSPKRWKGLLFLVRSWIYSHLCLFTLHSIKMAMLPCPCQLHGYVVTDRFLYLSQVTGTFGCRMCKYVPHPHPHLQYCLALVVRQAGR